MACSVSKSNSLFCAIVCMHVSQHASIAPNWPTYAFPCVTSASTEAKSEKLECHDNNFRGKVLFPRKNLHLLSSLSTKKITLANFRCNNFKGGTFQSYTQIPNLLKEKSHAPKKKHLPISSWLGIFKLASGQKIFRLKSLSTKPFLPARFEAPFLVETVFSYHQYGRPHIQVPICSCS